MRKTDEVNTYHAGDGPRLADRLAAIRRRRFVGRVAERDLFRSALRGVEPPFAVLHIYGPGGVGKTALLHEYAQIAAEAGRPTLLLDARNVEPSPAGFLLALRLALGLDDRGSPADALIQQGNSVILIDTYEAIALLDGWLREMFLPQLPAQSLVIIAGRNPPAPDWRADAAWQDLTHMIPLRNLRPHESRAYLTERGVSQTHHAAVLAWTHGHPLALSLVGDVLVHSNADAALLPTESPEVVRVLLERFVQHVPSPRHRQALDLCAHVRATTEALLAEALGGDDAHALFAWLRSLSFIEHSPDGVFPHDLVRDVLDADLRWRNPEAYRSMHYHIRRYLVRRVQQSQGAAQISAMADLTHLHRTSPLIKPFMDWNVLGHAHVEPAIPSDHPAILQLVRRHEGDEAVAIAQYWLQHQPRAFTVLRRGDAAVSGFVAVLMLDDMTPEDMAADPALAAAARFIQYHGPLRPGEKVSYVRFWMGREAYQDASINNVVALTAMPSWICTGHLAWAFGAVADPDVWSPMFAYMNFRRSPEADFTVGTRLYGVFTHDWRAEPVLAWLDITAERELATDLKIEQLEIGGAPPLVVLSEPEFAAALRQALRDYTRPLALTTNPLLRSRLMSERGSDGATPGALQALLREAAATLQANPKDRKLYDAVQRAYFQPAASQEQAAELLGLPFSTYRYHLAKGTERIIDWLWQRELYGLDSTGQHS